jgi:intraflagellar transport protein 74
MRMPTSMRQPTAMREANL